MKSRNLAILALAVLATASAHAGVTGVAEYDYNRVTRNGESHYTALGLVYTPKEGSWFVDGYAQAVTAYVGPRDNMAGWEFGAGLKFPVYGSVTGSTRLALGTMANINFGTGRANYALLSGELNYPISDKLAAYASVSHSNGLNNTAIPASNRAQVGVDYQIADKTWARVGLSTTRQINQWLNGAVIVVSRDF